MAFMEPEIVEGRYVAVLEGDGSTSYLPVDVWDDLGTDALETGEAQDVSEHFGILGRLSAPGYLDCTSWTPYDSAEEAERELTAEE